MRGTTKRWLDEDERAEAEEEEEEEEEKEEEEEAKEKEKKEKKLARSLIYAADKKMRGTVSSQCSCHLSSLFAAGQPDGEGSWPNFRRLPR
ncbi:hypothetical protein KPH14_003156 [Odynerus spinipes]|uniref:Uncharacterized protein n=1 Tax=Odynerus spinipes TaxID=1348599 RepID=A0AAD9VUG8_9HYME|nr:hypothetical protein KPH14_003156 [Odynerus spinipes]